VDRPVVAARLPTAPDSLSYCAGSAGPLPPAEITAATPPDRQPGTAHAT
jgi:hypothetical protein